MPQPADPPATDPVDDPADDPATDPVDDPATDPDETRRDRAVQAFTSEHGHAPDGVWTAPGRVNLIGEHTDYSGGLVLPMALPHTCTVAAAARPDDRVTAASRQRPDGAVSCDVSVQPGEVTGWAAYALGIVWALRAAGHRVGGVDLALDSQVPIGAGLSSSAAVGCSVALALRDLFELPLDPPAIAAIARSCENDFVGAPTGVMDQAVSVGARAGHLFFLDTASMTTRQVPFDLARHGLTLLVVDTRTSHELIDGGYGSRRQAVEDGTRLLAVGALRDVEDADAAWSQLERGGEPVVARRVRHVVTENARVQQVVDLLAGSGDPRRVGPVLTAGHRSLRDDFEISTPELDAAVEAALAAGAHGARMTGGGFGGSAIALVESGDVDRVREAVDAAYTDRGFAPAAYFTAVPCAGARRLG